MRSVTSGFQTELTANSINPAFFFECQLSESPLRLWTGFGDIAWDSKTWEGNGFLKDFQTPEENSDLQSGQLVVTLTGEPDALLAIFLSQIERGKKGSVYFGFLNSSDAVIADPDLFYQGYLDKASFEDGQQSSTLTLSFDSKLSDLQRSKEFRYTDESQKLFYPNDKGFNFTPEMADWQGYWGKNPYKKKKKSGKEK